MDSIQQMSGKVKTLTDKLMTKVRYAYGSHYTSVHMYELSINL